MRTPPTNTQCRHALVTGLVFDRPDPIARRQLRPFREGSLLKFFVFGHEIAHIWSPPSEEYCYLVVEVPSAPTTGLLCALWRVLYQSAGSDGEAGAQPGDAL